MDAELIIPIVRDKSTGRRRSLFVAALGKFKSAESRQLLTELLSDPDAKDKAESALKKI